MATPERIHTPLWSLELAPGWRAEDFGEYAVILNDHPDTTLRLTSLDLANGMTGAAWIERVAAAQRAQERPVAEVRCGDFGGIRAEFAWMAPTLSPRREDHWVRVWTLAYDGTPLDVTYRCPLWCAGRDDQVVVAMLATLEAGAVLRRTAP